MMKKLVKYGSGFVVLLLLAGGLILWNINPIVESFRPKLAQLISDTIQHPVEIGGITLNLFPTQAVELSGISLAGGTAGGATINRALLDVDLMALFKKRLEVSEVAIDDLNLDVSRDADGALKIGGLPMTPGKNAPDAAKPGEPRQETSSIAFHTKSFRLKRGKISIQDKKVNPAQNIEIGDINVAVDNITKEAIEKFALTASVLGREKENLKISGSVQGLAKGPMDAEPAFRISLKKLDLGKVAELAAAYGKRVDALTMKETVDLDISVARGPAGPSFEVKFDGKSASLAFGELFQKAAGVNLALDSSLIVPLPPTGVSASKLDVSLGNSTLSLPFSANFATKNGTMKIRSAGIQLAELQSIFPPAKPFGLGGLIVIDVAVESPPAASKMPLSKINGFIELKNVQASTTLPSQGEAKPDPITVKDMNGKIEFQEKDIAVKGLKVSVADQPLEIGLKVSGLPEPALQYALRSSKFNLGPLLKAVKPGGIEAVNGSSIDGLHVTGGYDVKSHAGNVTVNAEKGELANLPLAAVKLSADFSLSEAKALRQATLQPSNLGIFGGTVSFQGGVSAAQEISFQMKAAKLDLKKALDTLRPNSRISLTGTLDTLSLQITAKQADVPGTVAGPLSLLITNGTVEGLNIVGQALAKADVIPGLGAALLAFVPEKYAPLFKGDRTAFDRLTLDARLNGATTGLNSFTLSHAAYDVAGNGMLTNSGAKSGDMDINAQLTLSAELAAGMVAREPRLKLLQNEKGGIVFPIKISKHDGVPIVIPDVTLLAKRALSNTARDAATKVLNKGLDKVAPGLGGALDSLFK